MVILLAMIEVQHSENIGVKGYGGGHLAAISDTLEETAEEEEPAVVTDLRVHFATFDAPGLDR